MNTVTDIFLGCLALAAFPLIFFFIVVTGIKISMWAGEKCGGMNWLGWIVYMTGAFWSLGLGVGACALYASWMSQLIN